MCLLLDHPHSAVFVDVVASSPEIFISHQFNFLFLFLFLFLLMRKNNQILSRTKAVSHAPRHQFHFFSCVIGFVGNCKNIWVLKGFIGMI